MQISGEAVPPDGWGGLFDDMLGEVLKGWEGLRLYLSERQRGAPPDATFEVLLRERLRQVFGEHADIGAIIDHWLSRSSC